MVNLYIQEFYFTFAQVKTLHSMDRIESILKEKGLTKAAFADLMHTSRQNVNSLLRNPTREKLEEIAVALNVPVWQLFASPEDVAARNAQGDFVAFVRSGGKNFTFTDKEELRDFAKELCGEKPIIHDNIRGKEYFQNL